MSRHAELLRIIRTEIMLLTPRQRLVLDRLRTTFATGKLEFAPRSAESYSALDESAKQAADGRIRIEYVLTREIELLLLGGRLPKPLYDRLLGEADLLATGVFGTAGVAVAYCEAHRGEVVSVAARHASGTLFNRSGEESAEAVENVLALKPTELFAGSTVDPALVDQIVQTSLRGGGGAAPEGDVAWLHVLAEASGGRRAERADDIDGAKSATERGKYSSSADAVAKDDVDCSVFAPPVVRAGDSLLVSAYVHLPTQAGSVRAAASEADPTQKLRGNQAVGTRIAHGSAMAFELEVTECLIDEPRQTVVWQGRATCVQFVVTTPEKPRSNPCFGKLVICQETVPIGAIKFRLDIVRELDGHSIPVPTGRAGRFQSAFISYASQDRAQVLRRVQMLDAAGIEYFADLLSLEAGADWEQEIYRRIRSCDVLLLFWSSAAKKSAWVAREWKYAESLGRDGGIIPVIIEGPPPVAPPPELSHLHFNDRMQYFIVTEDRVRSTAGNDS